MTTTDTATTDRTQEANRAIIRASRLLTYHLSNLTQPPAAQDLISNRRYQQAITTLEWAMQDLEEAKQALVLHLRQND